MAKNKAYLVAFGKHLKRLIDENNVTPETVAARGHIETKQVYRVINGEHSAGLLLIYSISKGLGVHPKELFSFDCPD